MDCTIYVAKTKVLIMHDATKCRLSVEPMS